MDGSWVKSDAELDTYGLWLSWEGAHPVSQVHAEASALQGAVGGCEGDRTVADVGEGEGMGDHQTIHHIAKVQLECRERGPEGRVELQVTPIVLSQQYLFLALVWKAFCPLLAFCLSVLEPLQPPSVVLSHTPSHVEAPTTEGGGERGWRGRGVGERGGTVILQATIQDMYLPHAIHLQ